MVAAGWLYNYIIGWLGRVTGFDVWLTKILIWLACLACWWLSIWLLSLLIGCCMALLAILLVGYFAGWVGIGELAI